MKLIKAVGPECPCITRLWEFYNAQADEDGKPLLGTGTVVECDCGKRYTLTDSQRDGKYWHRSIPLVVA